jgi:tight adherence protein C
MSAIYGALIGGAIGAGAVTVVVRRPSAQRATLVDRVTPYLPHRSRPEAVDPLTPFVTLERVIAPAVRDLAAHLDRWLGGSEALHRRLERAGRVPDVERFRIEQAASAVGGAVIAVVFGALLAISGSEPSPLPLVMLVVIGSLLGAVAREQLLDREAARRRARMLAELPTLAELLALSVAAGEGVIAAIERVSKAGTGVLPEELARVVAEVRTGSSVVEALRRLSVRADEPSVSRFVDSIVIAVERGTPMADVLRAQAADVREGGRQSLMESAGRREIAMMVPVVFLVMPVTVLFALFPGFFGLSLTV